MARDTSRDTIIALASAPGRAGVAVLRVSGPQTADLLRALARSPLPAPRSLTLRTLRASDGNVLDRAMLAWFPGPASFTGEDCGELHLHGGPAIISAVLRAALATGLCRPAGPGEFSRRAVLNGKMDLAAAASVLDLINAETEAQRRQALRQLDGGIVAACEAWRRDLVEVSALVEASIDFSDEGDVAEDFGLQAATRLQGIARQMNDALAATRHAVRIRDGWRVALMGPPNAGKSSLLNALARQDVAIVSQQPGTTRDVIEIRCDIDGWPVTFFDTAGLRESTDQIEQIGVARARDLAGRVDIVVWLSPVDAPVEPPPDLQADPLVVSSKADLDGASEYAGIPVSVKQKHGTDVLLQSIRQRIESAAPQDPGLMLREWQITSVQDALLAIDQAVADLDHPELMAESLRVATSHLARLVDKVDAEDILDKVFSTFCIGK